MSLKQILKMLFPATLVGISAVLMIIMGKDIFTLEHDFTDYIKIIQSCFVILCAWILQKIIYFLIRQAYEKKQGNSPPQLLLTLQNIALFTFALIVVVKGIYHQPLAQFITMGGIVTAGIAIALQGMIFDAFSGLSLGIERPYRVGDWIKAGEIEGKVVQIGWRSTHIITSEQQMVLVPNGYFLKESFINYNQPESWYFQTLDILIYHDVPVARARRLIHTAVLSVKQLHNNLCHVYACQTEIGGIRYQVHYAVGSHEHWRETRHQVIESVTRQLHEQGIGIAEMVGEYTPHRRGKPVKLKQPLTGLAAISQTMLFKHLPKETLKKLAHKSKAIHVLAGDIIVKQEEKTFSLYIIIEGIAEVLEQYSDQVSESITMLKPGDYFGEYALLLGRPRSATVIARTDCLLIEIQKEVMQDILKKQSHLIEVLSEAMTLHGSELNLRKDQHSKLNMLSFKQEMLQEIKKIFEIA